LCERGLAGILKQAPRRYAQIHEAHFHLHEPARGRSPARLLRSSGQGELQRLFKVKLVRANKSGCLDQCELGPTVAVYPEGVFYGGVRPGDIEEIIESHIVNGKPVERQRIPDEILNTTHKKDGAGSS
jgi:(2Fe-2S) ferredoxin